jgi:hypothetical protein
MKLGSVSHWRSKPRLRQLRSIHCNSLLFTGAVAVREFGVFPTECSSRFRKHRVVVIACFRGRRNPRRWQSR